MIWRITASVSIICSPACSGENGERGGTRGESGGSSGGGGDSGGRGSVVIGGGQATPNASPQMHTPCTHAEVPSHGKPGHADGLQSSELSAGHVTAPEMPEPAELPAGGCATPPPPAGHVSQRELPLASVSMSSSRPSAVQRVV